MLILAVDTASGLASAAISKDGKIIAFSEGAKDALQAEELFTHINNVLGETKLSYDDFDHIAANLGPGSFTGIRIGLSAITAICFAKEKKLLGISTLEALAYKEWLTGNADLNISLNAGRNDAYNQKFSIDNKGALKASSEAGLVALDGLKLYETANAKDVAVAAYYMIKNNIADFTRKSPIYIRKPDAKVKAKK